MVLFTVAVNPAACGIFIVAAEKSWRKAPYTLLCPVAAQVAQPTTPVALNVVGPVADTATVPAAAGRLIVTVPNAPVTGDSVIVPLVAF
jgi:hypothetical protein